MDGLLRNNRVLVCAGSGGVGKTTMAASLAYRAAQLGLRVLVLTVDPAKRLATALGLDDLDDAAVLVSTPGLSGQLFAARVHPEKTFYRFVRDNAPTPKIGEDLCASTLFQKLTTTLSGSQEFTSLERLHEAVSKGEYDLVILDTPPTGHAIDILDATRRLENFMQDSVLKWFLSPFERHGLLSRMVNRGTRLVMGAFEGVVGAEFVDELMTFFGSISHYREPLVNRFRQIREIMSDAKTGFILVTSFDEQKLQEARYFRGALSERRLALRAVIVNRAFPKWFRTRDRMDTSAVPSEIAERFRGFYECLEHYFQVHQKEFDRFQSELGDRIQMVRLVDFDQDVTDIPGLARVAQELGLESEKEKTA